MEGAPTSGQQRDPKDEALRALDGLNGETLLYRGLTKNEELISKLSEINGGIVDPEAMEQRSEMYSKIFRTLHYNAGHAGMVGSNLEGDAIFEAEAFLDEEIAKLTRMRDALHA